MYFTVNKKIGKGWIVDTECSYKKKGEHEKIITPIQNIQQLFLLNEIKVRHLIFLFLFKTHFCLLIC